MNKEKRKYAECLICVLFRSTRTWCARASHDESPESPRVGEAESGHEDA